MRVALRNNEDIGQLGMIMGSGVQGNANLIAGQAVLLLMKVPQWKLEELVHLAESGKLRGKYAREHSEGNPRKGV